jgi:hypothetical protein
MHGGKNKHKIVCIHLGMLKSIFVWVYIIYTVFNKTWTGVCVVVVYKINVIWLQ